MITMWLGRFPKGVTVKYMHKGGTDIKACAKVVRYIQPILMVNMEI